MFSGGGGAQHRESGEGDSAGMLGSTASMLRGSMKSMGIGKKEEESSLSVGRVRRCSKFGIVVP